MILVEKFEYQFSKKQIEKFNDWKSKLPKIYTGAIGGRYTIEFTPTGIGTMVKVKAEKGKEIDLTEYDDF